MTNEAAPVEESLSARLAANVRYLIDATGFTIRRAAGLSNMGESTMRNFLGKPDAANPGLKTLQDLANALGCGTKPWWLLLPTADLRTQVETEGLDPFVLPRLGQISSGSTSSRASEAGAKIRATRTLLESAA